MKKKIHRALSNALASFFDLSILDRYTPAWRRAMFEAKTIHLPSGVNVAYRL
jgi:hypothetical protein